MMIIRQATKFEAPQLSILSNECGSDCWSESSFLAEFEHDSIILCCEYEGKLIGFSVVSVSFDEGYLHLIAVDSAHRQQGIATKLLKECEKVALSREVSKIVLDVRVSNNSAISLYEKFQYKTLCTRKNFYSNPKEDSFTMVKELEI